MTILSATLGRFVPRFRTLAEWAETYDKIVAAQDITPKTLSNRRCHIRRIVEQLGSRSVGQIKPHEIGQIIAALHAEHPVAAKRTLIEMRCMFNQAVVNGWTTSNPASVVRMPKSRVARRRLSLSHWREILSWSKEHQPPWVHRLFLLALVTGQRRSDLLAARFSHVWDDHLHIEQIKTGARIALPTALKMDAIGVSLADVIESCRSYARLDENGFLLRKSTGAALAGASASWRFEQAREGALPPHDGRGTPPTLHEIRSLSERMYRVQGVNTMVLLGHTNQSMTDLYNKDRGLGAESGTWRTLELPAP